jgi:hypothetical protein
MDFEFDEDNGFSSALGTETLTARDMVSEGFDNIPRAPASIEQLIQGRRYLRVDQSANKRHNSNVSKIWQYGSELRALDTPKKLITPERNSLADNTIEALECLKAWFNKGFIKRKEDVH